jgi:hypothetical protein
MRKPFDEDFIITQTFGNKLIIDGKDYYAQWNLLGHNGIDYGLPTGTRVLAPHDGTIIESANDTNGYGKYVKIENDKEGSVLGHMKSLSVKVGDKVKEGQEIGVSNNTGASTGPHLHIGYYRLPRNRNNGYNGFIDQTPYIGVISDPIQPQPADNYGIPIKEYLVSIGYQNSETHLDVIKEMHGSDLKLHSGQYVTVTDCNTEKGKLQESLSSNFEKEKQLWENQKAEAVKIAVEETEEKAKVATEVAVNEAKIEWDKQLEGPYKKYLEVKDTTSYKLCMSILTIFNKIKKGGEK